MITFGTAAAQTFSTSGSVNTEVNHMRFLTGSTKGAFIKKVGLYGHGADLTAIHGIGIRLYRYGTASTAGTGVTPRSRVPGATAILTAFHTPTPGATPTLQGIGGCGAAGPGGWQAWNRDSMLQLDANGGAAGNLDIISHSGMASLVFTFDVEHEE